MSKPSGQIPRVDEVSAGVALVWQGRVLVIRIRSTRFELPKGHLEQGESSQQAALRELAEETGLESEARCLRLLGEVRYTFQHRGSTIRKQVSYFLATTDAEPQFGPLPDATRERRWIDAAESANLPLVNEELRKILYAAFERNPNPDPARD